ncbi:UPF0637 protein [Enterococcus saigonensis]|uniref:UPF0637 protein EsVE80_20240 n=1 Tax=Enterococcus saigonensis TaxID=1805431 RepID=A0A679INS3_9ENTE|nr:DUF1054 domain-containing protein [Enterococcus saigonensis]BCA86501.1 UPF0637 protein [Enterococcus saigonensis]
MFNEKSFTVFNALSLEERMAAIRSEIQPIFTAVGQPICEMFTQHYKRPFYLHLAQHRRRTVHPPENTWAAMSEGKRGYKMSSHFQIGIWPEYVFMWLSIIDQPKGQKEMAELLLKNLSLFDTLPKDTVISLDHTKSEILPLTKENLENALIRLQTIKKAEFQIGRIIKKESELWEHPDTAFQYMETTYIKLLPLYSLLNEIH